MFWWRNAKISQKREVVVGTSLKWSKVRAFKCLTLLHWKSKIKGYVRIKVFTQNVSELRPCQWYYSMVILFTSLNDPVIYKYCFARFWSDRTVLPDTKIWPPLAPQTSHPSQRTPSFFNRRKRGMDLEDRYWLIQFRDLHIFSRHCFLSLASVKGPLAYRT